MSDDEDKDAPPHRGDMGDSAIIGGIDQTGTQYAYESIDRNLAIARINRNNTHNFEPEFQSIRTISLKEGSPKMGQSNQEGNTKRNKEFPEYSPDRDSLKQWQSNVDNQHGVSARKQNKCGAGPSKFAHDIPQDSMMCSIPSEGGLPKGVIPRSMAYNFMNGGTNDENDFSNLSSQNQQGMNHNGPRIFNVGPNPSFGLPSMNSRRNKSPESNPFELLSGQEGQSFPGNGFQGDNLPLDFPLKRQDCIGSSQFSSQVNNDYQQRPNLYDQFANDQQARRDDPCFYKNIDLPPSPPKQTPQNFELSHAVLKNSFERYSVGGVINTGNFMKLIEEIYSFNRLPHPDYKHCLYVMSQYDANRDGCIDFDEFKIMMREI